ncbi:MULTISPECIES: MbtH family protein [unclassified Streptomyces]|uniref:MbtH family protein n=1 Tax=unclassified Streptomyces TaxID=2593676 RepID=UPI003812FA39
MERDEQHEPNYQVVVNGEEQYSIWPEGGPLPAGWAAEGTVGPRDVCLARIEEVWVDMRPLSLRRRMAAAGKS